MYRQFCLVSISIILVHKKGRLPVKWTAYEALSYGTRMEHTQHKVTCKYITPFNNITFSI